MKEKGIAHQTTVPYNPAQIGVAERMNRTIIDTALAMMSHAKVPMEFWAKAIHTAIYLRNRRPTTLLNGIIPFEALFGHKPDVSNLRVFGCLAYAYIPKEEHKKFQKNSRKYLFVGYLDGSIGYKLYDFEMQRFIHTRDVVFAEGEFHDFKESKSLEKDSYSSIQLYMNLKF